MHHQPLSSDTFQAWSSVIAVLLSALLALIAWTFRAVSRWKREIVTHLDALLAQGADHERRIRSLEVDRDRFHPRLVDGGIAPRPPGD